MEVFSIATGCNTVSEQIFYRMSAEIRISGRI
jgi:hypothetical protein